MTFIIFSIVIALSLIVCATTVSFLIAYLHGAVVVSTRADIIHRALEIAKVTPKDTLVDLGSGWGNVIHRARTDFGARSIGYEVALIPYLYSLLRGEKVYLRSFKRAHFIHVTVVYLYLSPEVIRSLLPEITQLINHGVRIVSVSFHIPGFTPKKLEKYHRHKIYLYA